MTFRSKVTALELDHGPLSPPKPPQSILRQAAATRKFATEPATVAVTVATHDLAAGVVVGVPLSGLFFAFKVMRLMAVTVSYDAATDTGDISRDRPNRRGMFADSFDLRDTGRNVRNAAMRQAATMASSPSFRSRQDIIFKADPPR
jgi:MFS superfamily sulfate permease-like transporter